MRKIFLMLSLAAGAFLAGSLAPTPADANVHFKWGKNRHGYHYDHGDYRSPHYGWRGKHGRYGFERRHKSYGHRHWNQGRVFRDGGFKHRGFRKHGIKRRGFGHHGRSFRHHWRH